ncbi:hypothetical protein ES702_04435 [subsurface metagenome]
MKNLIVMLCVCCIAISCTVTIPMQTNLSDQTMLLAENKNINANTTISSNIPDGFLKYTAISKNGNETPNNDWLKYPIETAFKKIWNGYFSAKYTEYSKDTMVVMLVLEDFYFRDQSATSMGGAMFTGNVKTSLEATSVISAIIIYHNETYHKKVEVSTSDYNEFQQMKAGNTYYTSSQTNPTQQKSDLIDACLNKGIVQFENFVNSVLITDKEK